MLKHKQTKCLRLIRSIRKSFHFIDDFSLATYGQSISLVRHWNENTRTNVTILYHQQRDNSFIAKSFPSRLVFFLFLFCALFICHCKCHRRIFFLLIHISFQLNNANNSFMYDNNFQIENINSQQQQEQQTNIMQTKTLFRQHIYRWMSTKQFDWNNTILTQLHFVATKPMRSHLK